MRRLLSTIALAALVSTGAPAEEASYGSVELTGLARASWDLNPLGQQSAMVCNVNGPDGFLSIRSGPGTNHKIKRRLKRLATIEVDTRARKGRWIQVITASRQFTTKGKRRSNKSLHVTGWVHDGYLCDFIDY